jgi:hypothetical protein
MWYKCYVMNERLLGIGVVHWPVRSTAHAHEGTSCGLTTRLRSPCSSRSHPSRNFSELEIVLRRVVGRMGNKELAKGAYTAKVTRSALSNVH